jgi:hypothetical protein
MSGLSRSCAVDPFRHRPATPQNTSDPADRSPRVTSPTRGRLEVGPEEGTREETATPATDPGYRSRGENRRLEAGAVQGSARADMWRRELGAQSARNGTMVNDDVISTAVSPDRALIEVPWGNLVGRRRATTSKERPRYNRLAINGRTFLVNS